MGNLAGRRRNLHFGFFMNEDLADLTPLTRLFLAGLWCIADKEGRLHNRPKKLAARVLPYDNFNGIKGIEDLESAGFIDVYEVDGKGFIQIVNWSKYQNPHYKETASIIPPPSTNDKSKD